MKLKTLFRLLVGLLPLILSSFFQIERANGTTNLHTKKAGASTYYSLYFGQTAHLPAGYLNDSIPQWGIAKGYGIKTATIYSLQRGTVPLTKIWAGVTYIEFDADVQVCANSKGFPNNLNKGNMYGDAATQFEATLSLVVPESNPNVTFGDIFIPSFNERSTVTEGPWFPFTGSLGPNQCHRGIIPFIVSTSLLDSSMNPSKIISQNGSSPGLPGVRYTFKWSSPSDR